ncbi:hypothetical protein RvY_00865 [Ramazzottius varieornatus]|uniref:Uncharacterized protein n=1 Tax=Ramazzottius varieornatus TaxID=947166 RepID=A0A1D1UEA0_RAMVA|nr:hypothetical protein RvY_00865 [Ramazzottius varieornatus]
MPRRTNRSDCFQLQNTADNFEEKNFTSLCLRPHHVECSRSRSISEDKLRRARSTAFVVLLSLKTRTRGSALTFWDSRLKCGRRRLGGRKKVTAGLYPGRNHQMMDYRLHAEE